jgi:ABC-type sulfate transport system permease component
MAMQSVWNTVWFSAAAATIAVVLALLIAYIVNRRLVRFGDALAFVAMAPFVIPGIVMAIGFYAAYAAPPLALYGTATLIILAFAARFLPIAYANSAAAIRAVHPEMEEAARRRSGSRSTRSTSSSSIEAVADDILRWVRLCGRYLPHRFMRPVRGVVQGSKSALTVRMGARVWLRSG